jgi:hypothetical protein
MESKDIEQHYLRKSLDNDLVTYLSYKQMYVTKEIVSIDFQTQFSANTVYLIFKIDIHWLNENNVCLTIFSEVIECNIWRTVENIEDFYNEIKSLFIPVKDLFEAWKTLQKSNQ